MVFDFMGLKAPVDITKVKNQSQTIVAVNKYEQEFEFGIRN